MRKQDITIKISPTGEVSFTIEGVKGAKCLDETRFLEDALGGGVIEQERTSEYYEESDYTSDQQYAGSGEDD